MQNITQPISSQALLEKARLLMEKHDEYFADMMVNEVTQRNGVLIFRGPWFLDENELPTRKTTAVFNVFKYLATTLSADYHLEE